MPTDVSSRQPNPSTLVMRKAGRCANSPGHGRTFERGSTMAEYTCVQCGTTHKAPPSTAAKRLYCSWDCRLASGQHHLQGKAMAVRYVNCAACGRLICRRAKRVGRYENAYCDMACRNVGYGDGSRRTVEPVQVLCQREGCNRTWLVAPSKIANGRGRFCSRACEESQKWICGDPDNQDRRLRRRCPSRSCRLSISV